MFLVFIHDFIICIDFTGFLPISLLQTQQLIRSHIEYLIQIYNILVLTL